MSEILKVKDFNKGAILKQGDSTTLKYYLYDADEEQIESIIGKTAEVVFIKGGQVYYRTSGVISDLFICEFKIEEVLPTGVYHIEFLVDGHIFPSGDKPYFTLTASSKGINNQIITAHGFEEVVILALEEVESRSAERLAELESDYATRLTGLEQKDNQLTAQLAQKVDKGNVSVSDINKNLGKLDQKYMSDEFLQQMAGNSPINATPANQSLTSVKYVNKSLLPQHADFITLSSNLYDESKNTLNTIVLVDGTVSGDNGAYHLSEFILVNPNTVYFSVGCPSIAEYDEDRNFIRRFDVADSGGSFTTKTDTYYIRMNMQFTSPHYANGRLNLGSDQGYEPYRAVLKDVKTDENALEDNSVSEQKVKNNAITSAKRTSLGELPLIIKGQSGGLIDLDTVGKTLTFGATGFLFHRDKRYTIPSGTVVDFSSIPVSGIVIYYDLATGNLYPKSQTQLTGITETSVIIAIAYAASGEWNLLMNADYSINGNPKFIPYGEMITSEKRTNLGELPLITKGASGGLIDFDSVAKTLTFDATGFLFHRDKRYTIPTGTVVDCSSIGGAGIVIYYDLATGTLYPKSQTQLFGITETSVIIAIAYATGAEWNLLMNADYTVNGKPKFMPYGETIEARTLPYQFPVEKLNGDFPESDLTGVGEVGNPFDGVNVDYNLVYSLFDGLMSDNPSYITREQIGLSTNSVPIYCYHFKPEIAPITAGPLLKPYPKVLMDSSIHGGERLGTYTLYFLFKRICEDWQTDKGLEYLRHYVNFSIVPLPNPEDYTIGQYAGINGVNLNRDFDFAWQPSAAGAGATAFSRVESQVMRDFFIANDDALLFVNIHVRGHAVTDDAQTMWLGSSDIRETPILTNTIEKMTRKWKQKYPALKNVDGQLGRITTRDGAGTIKSYAHQIIGIPSILWEGFKATPTMNDFEGKDVVDMNVQFLGETVFNIIKHKQG